MAARRMEGDRGMNAPATSEPQNRLTLNERAARIGMLTRAAGLLGQTALAGALGIEPRSLRAKLSVDRGVGDHDLRLAAAALTARAATLRAQADAITAHLGNG